MSAPTTDDHPAPARSPHDNPHDSPPPAAETLRFAADDGRILEGSLFRSGGTARAAVLIAGATGVPRGFYRRYAEWLAAQGYSVLSFDYRGVGDSRIDPLRDDPARMRDWGQRDLPAALDRLAEAAPGLPLLMIGHSVGGQMLGVMRNHDRVSACVMICTGIGYWGGMPRAFGLMTLAIWYGIEPLSRRLLGYAPNARLGWGENLPAGVSSDWRRWCLRADYFAELRDDDPPAQFDAVRTPILSLRVPDDPIATEANVDGLLRFYPQAPIERRLLRPADFGLRGIGHLHFFSARMPETLWRQPLDWFEQQLAR